MSDARIHLMFVKYVINSSCLVAAKSHSERGYDILKRRWCLERSFSCM